MHLIVAWVRIVSGWLTILITPDTFLMSTLATGNVLGKSVRVCRLEKPGSDAPRCSNNTRFLSVFTVVIDVCLQLNLYRQFPDYNVVKFVCVMRDKMIEKIIKPTTHAEASLCMFNVAICLDNYGFVKHSEYLVRDVRLKLF